MRAVNCTIEIEQPVEQVVPLTFRAIGQEGPARVTCLRREVSVRACTSVVAAEFLVEVPVRLSISADCEGAAAGSHTEVTCTAKGLVAVELPLAFGACRDNDESYTRRIFLTPVVTAGCTLVQDLEIALPLTLGATASCSPAGGAC